jgi:hypothetical protein
MPVSEEHIDLFERYSHQQLSEKEVLGFDSRLVYDEDFSLQFEQYKQIEQGIRNHYRNEMKQRFLSIDEEMDHMPHEKYLLKKKWIVYFAAASLVLLTFTIYISSQRSELSQLAFNYWPEEPGLPVRMSSKGEYDDAMNAYKLDDFSKATKLLENIQSDTSNYFRGIIAYKTDDSKEAKHCFIQIKKNSVYFQKAKFRLGLILLSEGDINSAKNMFKSQMAEKTEFANASEEILKKF